MIDKYIKKTKISSKVRISKTSKYDKGLKTPFTFNNKFTGKPQKANQLIGFLPTYNKSISKTIGSLGFKDFFKGQFNTGFIKKSTYEIGRKAFTKKINLNKIQGCRAFNRKVENKNIKNLHIPSILRVKTSIYLLLKTLKNLKKITLSLSLEEGSLNTLDLFCLKLEKSGFYVSLTEWKKKRNFGLVKVKTKKRLCDAFVNPSNSKKYVGYSLHKKIIPIKSSYQNFQKKSTKVYNTLAKIKIQGLTIQKGFVHLKKNYSYITESRVSLYMATYKKKYTKLFRIMKKNKIKFRRLFFNFLIKQLRHTSRMKKRYKLYRSLTWKRKKKKNRRKVGLFYFLRRQPRMLFRFYIPKHLEINYKTFSLVHLGELDLQSVNPRISFWLNLRRLLTSLAI